MDHLTLSTTVSFGLDEAFVLTRAELDTRRPPALHRQDFHEMLWVQNGKVRLHSQDGRRDLREGDVLFITPDQPHGLQGRSEAALVVSIAIRPGVIAALGRRHAELSGTAFWTGSATPVLSHCDIRQLAALNKAALRLEQAPRRKLYLEAFLLPILVTLDRRPDEMPASAPDWLVAACAAAQTPDVFRQGAAGFVAAAGRAHPHVARSMRKYMGQTPSDYVNRQRMAFAARKLAGTSDTLAEIAENCGIPNLSHFHKVFLATHGETPQRYRRARQRDMVQPRP